jgi:hypothetical protein
MMIAVELPRRGSLEFATLIQGISRQLAGRHVAPAEIGAVLDVLIEMNSGPRYAAVPTGTHDALGSPGYQVVDRRHGSIEHVYEGYFAGQDARRHAVSLNEGA